ncbi:MAG: hemerythrin domain-containing protein [Rhizobiales bacterium]|nr:hemerythrin domain-containing protein [Hyphomicrobiales bacterium]
MQGSKVDDALEVLISSPIDALELTHSQHAELCNILEQIADSLPDEVEPPKCRQARDCLLWEVPLHHKDEEEGLFPLLEKRALPEDNIVEHLAQLSLEHATDESFADELSEHLEHLSNGEKPLNPNMLGYMLRGFFESYRRHLHWENSVLLPLARKRLTPTDLKTLRDVMIDNRQT